MDWMCNYCGHKVQPIKEVEPDGTDWPAGRGCSECGKGEMVYRPAQKPPTVTFVVQESKGYDIWTDCYGLEVFSEIQDAVKEASERHDRYHFNFGFRVVRRVEKVEWEGKRDE